MSCLVRLPVLPAARCRFTDRPSDGFPVSPITGFIDLRPRLTRTCFKSSHGIRFRRVPPQAPATCRTGKPPFGDGLAKPAICTA